MARHTAHPPTATAPAKPIPLDWTLIRGAVRAARETCTKDGVRWSRERLSKASRIDQTTIYRIEAIAAYPRYRPDLETIARLIWTMDLSLAELFATVESRMSSGGNGRGPQRRQRPATRERGRPAAVHPEVSRFFVDSFAGLGQQLERAVDVAVDRSITKAFRRMGAGR